MTSGSATRRLAERQEKLDHVKQDQSKVAVRRRRMSLAAWGAALLIVVALVTAALLTTRPVVSADTREAPGFTLPTSDGGSVSLSSLRGAPVLLFFSEGAGCDACLLQLAEIEKEPGFADAGIKVLPIVMNTAEQITAEGARFGVTSPFLLDDGKVSDAYETLGTGMHKNLPGHGFVLVDAEGVQRWFGDYPSMWIEPKDLLEEVLSRL